MNKDRIEIRPVSALLRQCWDALSIVCARVSAKANNDVYYIVSCCLSRRSPFVGFSLFLAMFYFPSDISVFFIL